MAVIGTNEYNFSMFGNLVTVPDADIAKIMYYIDCVCTAIEYNDNNISRYRNYANWYNMSDEEDRLIFLLGLTLSPKELEDKVFFNSPALCPESSNQFYKIGQVQNRLLISSSIVIGGQTRRVNNIMAYKAVWMQKNYYQPMSRLINRFSPDSQRQAKSQSRSCVIS